MSAYQIRGARLEDAAALENVIRSLGWFKAVSEQTQEAAQEQIRQHLELCLADGSHSAYAAEDESGSVVGYASVHWLPYLILAGPEGYVSELFITASSRGLGIGKLLLEAVEAEALRRGCTRLALINNRGRESYQRAFYTKAGWVERPEMANFVKDLRPK